MHSRRNGGGDGDSVETVGLLHREIQRAKACFELQTEANKPLGDGSKTIGAMVHRIKRSDHRQQHLRRTNVARGLIPADVLLTGLQRQAQSRIALGILRLTHKPTRDLAFVGLPRRKKCCVRAAESHRHTKTLGTAHCDVSTKICNGREQGLRQRINRHRHQSTALMGTFDQRGGVPEQTIRAGELQQHPKHTRIKSHLLGINPLKLNSQWLRPGLQHSPGLWEHMAIDEETIRFGTSTHTKAQAHGFCRGRGFIQQGGIRDRKPSELTDQRLKIQQRLKPPLGNLSLIRGVGGIPSRVLKHVALNQRRRCCAVISEANQRSLNKILRSDRAEICQCLSFATPCRKQVAGRGGIKDVVGDNILDEIIQMLVPQRLQHLVLLSIAWAQMPLLKRGSHGLQRGKAVILKKGDRLPSSTGVHLRGIGG